MNNNWIRLAIAAGELDRAGLIFEADILTSVIERHVCAQMNGPANFYPNTALQQGVLYSEGESEFEDRDDSRNKEPRYQGGGDGVITPGAIPDMDARDSNGNLEPHAPTEMNAGGGDPGVQVVGDPMSPSQMGGTDQFTWENTRGKNENPADSYKKLLPH